MDDSRKMKECSLLISKAVSSFPFCPSPHLQCLYRNSHGRCSVKKAFSKISQNSQENVSIGINTGFSL